MLTVKDLMTVNPCTIAPDTPLRKIIHLMKSEGCRQLPVVGEGKLVGIVTDRDVRVIFNSPLTLRWHQQDEKLLDQTTAVQCMTPDPVTVTPDTPAYHAAKVLSIYKFGALPVVANEGTGKDALVGIITITDFLRYFAAKRSEPTIDDLQLAS